MQTITINGTELKATKNEARDATDTFKFLKHDASKEFAQKRMDIALRSSPNDAALARRQAIARALGLNDQIQYL